MAIYGLVVCPRSLHCCRHACDGATMLAEDEWSSMMTDSKTLRIVPEPARARYIVVVGNVFRALFRQPWVCFRIPAFFLPLSHPYPGSARVWTPTLIARPPEVCDAAVTTVSGCQSKRSSSECVCTTYVGMCSRQDAMWSFP